MPSQDFWMEKKSMATSRSAYTCTFGPDDSEYRGLCPLFEDLGANALY